MNIDTQQQIKVGQLCLPKQFVLDLTDLQLPKQLQEQRHYTLPDNLKDTWELVRFAHNPKTSYCGVLLKTTVNNAPTYVIWHYGTNDMRDIPSGLSITLGKLPPQLRDALHFTRDCKEEIARSGAETAHVLQTGHSLGGALAVLANRDGDPCLTLDAPGTRHFMEKLGRSPETCREHTVEILSPHENLVNTQGQHVGNIIMAGAPFWYSKKSRGMKCFIEMTMESHALCNLNTALKANEDLTPHPPDALNRSPSFFHAYLKFKHSREEYGNLLKENGAVDMAKLSHREKISLFALERTLQKGTATSLEGMIKTVAMEISSLIWPQWRNRVLESFVPTPVEQKEGNKLSWRERLTHRGKVPDSSASLVP